MIKLKLLANKPLIARGEYELNILKNKLFYFGCSICCCTQRIIRLDCNYLKKQSISVQTRGVSWAWLRNERSANNEDLGSLEWI